MSELFFADRVRETCVERRWAVTPDEPGGPMVARDACDIVRVEAL